MSDETPNTGIPYVPQNVLDPAAGINAGLDHIDALLQTGVISMALGSPPGSPADGELYIVASPASGAWTGHATDLARYVADGSFWQFFDAGDVVRLVLNQADGGFYKFLTGSPGGWTLAAGLDDAPSDGTLYGRQDGAWEPLTLTVVELDVSPAIVVSDVTSIVFEGATVSEDTGGVARVTIGEAAGAPVISEAGTARTADPSDAGSYVRFTNASAKTYTFDDGDGFTKGQEFHGRNVGSADLTITEAGGMTINAPFGGSLVVPQGGTFTVKIVTDAGDEADLFGVTS